MHKLMEYGSHSSHIGSTYILQSEGHLLHPIRYPETEGGNDSHRAKRLDVGLLSPTSASMMNPTLVRQALVAN